LGWARWALIDLGWRDDPGMSVLLLLAPSVVLAFSAVPGLWFLERHGLSALRDETQGFLSWLFAGVRCAGVPAAVVVGLSWSADVAKRSEIASALLDTRPALWLLVATAALFTLFTLSPLFLLALWRTEPFPLGSFRDAMEQRAAALGAPLRGIRVWDASSRWKVNACAAGILPGTRLIVFTQGLLCFLPPPEVEAVFCHELAHFVRRHLRLYAALATAFILALAPFRNAIDGEVSWVGGLSLVAYAGFFWIVIFGAVSRRLETEADLTAARLVGSATYVAALRRVAGLVGPSSARSGLRHASLERRIAIVEAASGGADEMRGPAFRVRLAVAALFLASAGVFTASALLDRPRGDPQPAEVHRRVDAALAYGPVALAALGRARSKEAGGIARWLAKDPQAVVAELEQRIVDARDALAQASALPVGEREPLARSLEDLVRAQQAARAALEDVTPAAQRRP
jgi:Zn-dependent protease with chaperone function